MYLPRYVGLLGTMVRMGTFWLCPLGACIVPGSSGRSAQLLMTNKGDKSESNELLMLRLSNLSLELETLGIESTDILIFVAIEGLLL